MHVFLVRHRRDKEIVGLFHADDVADLIDMIDEGTVPSACEAALMPRGGLIWYGPEAPKVPEFEPAEYDKLEAQDDDKLEESDDFSFQGVGMNDDWASVFLNGRNFDGQELKWMPIIDHISPSARLGD